MADFLTPAERSERMSRIRGKDTRPELALRKILHSLGLRYRLHGVGLIGKPDIVFSRYKTVIFVHGCFWHRHAGCSIATTPKTNTSFWIEKFNKNVLRDARVVSALENLGWKVIIVWECELNSYSRCLNTGKRLVENIRNG
jgi:DNA mismatch endonuclease (patch repair protein)